MAPSDQLVQKLAAFMTAEKAQGARDGFAYGLADSLLKEAQAGGQNCLRDLTPLKKAFIDHLVR
jgi:hypothetical protein